MSEIGVNVAPAAPVQKSMWAAGQRYRAMPLNLLILAWRVTGPLDPGVLQQALNDVVARHPTLRSRLVMQAGQLMQATEPAATVELQVADVEADTEALRQAQAMSTLRDLGRRPLDITTELPLRAHLLRLVPGDAILGLYVHHAMCDGWSSQIIIRDLAAFYVARRDSVAASLPAMTEQFADVSAAQLARHQSGGYAQEIAYWRAELAGLPPPVELPAKAPRKGMRDFLADSPVHAEPPAVLAALKAFARQRRVSHFSVLLSAVSVLLHLRTGVEDMIIGVPTLNRWSPAAMQYVGCATSLLPARVRLSPASPFGDVCTAVHGTIRRLLAHGRIPLEMIIRETQDTVVGGLTMPVWCQVRETAAPVAAGSDGPVFSMLVVERGALQSELDVDMLEGSQGLLCEFAHRPALFDGAMVAVLMSEFGTLLRAAPQRPEAPIRDLS